jgi:hypothetical protein
MSDVTAVFCYVPMVKKLGATRRNSDYPYRMWTQRCCQLFADVSGSLRQGLILLR